MSIDTYRPITWMVQMGLIESIYVESMNMEVMKPDEDSRAEWLRKAIDRLDASEPWIKYYQHLFRIYPYGDY